jgi:hypothetical protein
VLEGTHLGARPDAVLAQLVVAVPKGKGQGGLSMRATGCVFESLLWKDCLGGHVFSLIDAE